jgi:hypothetical protein
MAAPGLGDVFLLTQKGDAFAHMTDTTSDEFSTLIYFSSPKRLLLAVCQQLKANGQQLAVRLTPYSLHLLSAVFLQLLSGCSTYYLPLTTYTFFRLFHWLFIFIFHFSFFNL